MQALKEVVARLITGGMDPADAAALMAAAVIEGSSKKRSSGAERALRYRERKASAGVTNRDAVTSDKAPPERDESVTNRDNVTLPNTNKDKNSSRARTPSRQRRAMPSDFQLDNTMREFAASKGFDPPRTAREFEKFCNYHRAKGSVFADWQAAWRTWVNNGIDYARAAGGGGQGGFQWNGIEGVI